MRSFNHYRVVSRISGAAFLTAVIAGSLTACGHVHLQASSDHQSTGVNDSTIVWALSSGAPRTTAARRDVRALNTAFSRAEDTYEAMFAPPPTHKIAATALQDNMAVPAMATLDSTGRHAYLTRADKVTIESRAMAELEQVFTPAMVRREYKIVVGVVGTVSSGQDLLGGGGASVVRFLDESIKGSTGSIQADVKQWSRIGYVNPQTGKLRWQVNHAIVIVKDLLVKSSSGNWLVVSRSWKYAPGQGP